jgi:hypothetical protein
MNSDFWYFFKCFYDTTSAAVTWLTSLGLNAKQVTTISCNGLWSAFAENRADLAVEPMHKARYYQITNPRPNYHRMGQVCSKPAQQYVKCLLDQPADIMITALRDNKNWCKEDLMQLKRIPSNF